MRYSVLDLAPINQGSDAAQSLRNTLDLARHAERWGYHRYWLAEHHNMPGIASAATAVVIGHVAAGTKTIRVGAGGIMLPNHAPLTIAEQFGTLSSLFPGRIDLGLGRAPGSDQFAARALRRGLGSSGDTFPHDVVELQSYFRPVQPGQTLRAVPGAGLEVPLYILGSSDFGARLAAELGLPFAFASHFAPEHLEVALELYRSRYQPSSTNPRPHAIVGVNVIAANTDAEAQRLFTSLQQAFLNLVRGRPGQLPPPIDAMDGRWSESERARSLERTRISAVGSPDIVRQRLAAIIDETGANEIMVTAMIFDHGARLRSFEIAAEVLAELVASEKACVG